MITRFSLYGFLKNQRYFEPYLVLAFAEKGLSLFAIGGLIAFREVATNLLEIPSGAIADLCGRRRSMILSFFAYIVSFLMFGLCTNVVWLFPAMLLFSVGDAFRTGTHKAMIFAWLRQQGRVEEKTQVYGYTRSWSKIGSAVAVVLGTVMVLLGTGYSWLFVIAAIPYVCNTINFVGYPRSLEGEAPAKMSVRAVMAHTVEALRDTLRNRSSRRLFIESMGFEGVFHAAKDFLQPLLAAAAVGLWATNVEGAAGLDSEQRSAILVGPVYFVLFLCSGIASRQAHRFAAHAGSEEAAARRIWLFAALLFATILVGELSGVVAASILAFVALHVLQNLWRPILISRFDAVGDASRGATTMSIESQGRRLATAILAPMLGLALDASRAQGSGFWPIGALGLTVAGSMWGWARARSR